MSTVRDLIIWQKSIEPAIKLFIKTKEFPKKETYSITSQTGKATVSIPNSLKEYLRFLNITICSLFKLQTQIEIAKNLSFLNNDSFKVLYENSSKPERILSSFIRTVKKSI